MEDASERVRYWLGERKILRIDDFNHEHRCTCTTCNDDWERNEL